MRFDFIAYPEFATENKDANISRKFKLLNLKCSTVEPKYDYNTFNILGFDLSIPLEDILWKTIEKTTH